MFHSYSQNFSSLFHQPQQQQPQLLISQPFSSSSLPSGLWNATMADGLMNLSQSLPLMTPNLLTEKVFSSQSQELYMLPQMVSGNPNDRQEFSLQAQQLAFLKNYLNHHIQPASMGGVFSASEIKLPLQEQQNYMQIMQQSSLQDGYFQQSKQLATAVPTPTNTDTQILAQFQIDALIKQSQAFQQQQQQNILSFTSIPFQTSFNSLNDVVSQSVFSPNLRNNNSLPCLQKQHSVEDITQCSMIPSMLKSQLSIELPVTLSEFTPTSQTTTKQQNQQSTQNGVINSKKTDSSDISQTLRMAHREHLEEEFSEPHRQRQTAILLAKDTEIPTDILDADACLLQEMEYEQTKMNEKKVYHLRNKAAMKLKSKVTERITRCNANQKSSSSQSISAQSFSASDYEPIKLINVAKRNNDDPYQNYHYPSQIQNQLRKQVLKCFFKHAENYLGKNEAKMQKDYPQVQKPVLLAVSKYWSQFDNPQKRLQLKEDDYRKYCCELKVNPEIKPLGQKNLQEIFCHKTDFSRLMRVLFCEFNADIERFASRQKQPGMRKMYIETCNKIYFDITQSKLSSAFI